MKVRSIGNLSLDRYNDNAIKGGYEKPPKAYLAGLSAAVILLAAVFPAGHLWLENGMFPLNTIVDAADFIRHRLPA